MSRLPSEIDTLVVGAGQAGIAMSEHLSKTGVPHLVLERDRIAERWRTGRWDSLVANGPVWHDRFPGLAFDGMEDESFASKDRVTQYLEDYAASIQAPVRTGVEVQGVWRSEGRVGFRVETSEGQVHAQRVVVATGPFQRPVIPDIVPPTEGLLQIHSAHYRNPQQLPPGAVLVVGSGSSGVQIADELKRSGRHVFLSVGPHDRPPRRYRGRDYCWWLGVLGEWDRDTPAEGHAHVAISVSGARGGETVDFRRLGHQGVVLVGRAESCAGGVVHFAGDLQANVARGDANYLSVLDAADAYAQRNGLDLPLEPTAREISPDPECLAQPLRSLDLAAAGVRSIVWATGYESDFNWLHVDAVDAQGKPQHQRGVSNEPGIYFLGLSWMSRRGSAFIWGVWHDAKYVADQIAIQRRYLSYHQSCSLRAAS